MNRKITAALMILIAILLDSVFFTQVNVLGMRPDTLLAVTISYAVLSGSGAGAVFGLVGGLLLDVIAGRFFGLYGALYMAVGLAAGFFYKKFYADNIIVPALTALALGLMKELFLSLAVLIGGAQFVYYTVVLLYILPSAVMSGLLCALLHLMLKPLLARQVKRSQMEKLMH